MALNILVTGGAGFIGSALVRRLIAAGHRTVNVDKLTYAGDLRTIESVLSDPLHVFLQADIADHAAMSQAFNTASPDVVFNLAAESHVDRSIDGPGVFLETNVCGTFVLLQHALHFWRRLPLHRRETFRFIQVSTDEVFGSLPGKGLFHQNSGYAPNSPYSASKAAADHLVRAWNQTYGLPAIITNCSNNYGPYQHPEKLIPTVIRSALREDPIPVYGTGQNVRDWLHVEDHVTGLLTAATKGRSGARYLFGGCAEITNLTLCRTLCGLLDERQPRLSGRPYAELITFVADRPGHDYRYAVDCSTTERELGWRRRMDLRSGLEATVDWFLSHPDWVGRSVKELARHGLFGELVA